MRQLLLSFLCLSVAFGAAAQTATPAAAPIDLNSQLQKFMSSKQGQKNIGPALAGGMLLNCTQKQTGREAAQAFSNKIQTATQAIHEQCKQGNAAQAKQMTLATLDANVNDPVAKAVLTCYDTQRTALEGMAGPDWSAQAAHYSVWARDPSAAHREMTEADVCRRKTPSPQ